MPPVHATLAEITGFLERHPPFSALSEEALGALAATAEIEYFAAGTEILTHEGPPSLHLFVVRRGAVELLDDGETVDVLDEGESFGHPSLLSGLSPAFTVRAREDSLCLLFPAEVAVNALSEPAGVRYVAASLAERMARAVSRPTAPWGTGGIGERARAPVTCEPETPIREAAARMTEAGEQAVVVPLADDGYCLVTDHDLRASVVTGKVSTDAPLAAVARGPALSAPADRQVFEALLDMLEAGVESLVVVGRDGRLLGVVDHAALLDLSSPSPFVVRRAVERARDPLEVAEAVRGLPHVAVRLLDASVAPLDVLSTLATTADAVTRRLTELAIDDLGDPPGAWAWLSLGSQARREQTLATDQDNALAYDSDDAPAADEYFAAFAERVNGWLADSGYALCRAGVMARNAGWRLSRTGWHELFRTWLLAPTRRDVHMAMIGLDLREVAGPLPVEQDLLRILESAPEHPYFLERLGQAALEHRPPLGFLRELVVERTGDHAGTLDLKTIGVGPIVSLARRHALAAGATVTGTVARLRAAAARGTLDEESALELEEAFVTITRFRLEHQAAHVERGIAPDNHVDPAELAPLARRQLKDAFGAVARAQRSLATPVATRIR